MSKYESGHGKIFVQSSRHILSQSVLSEVLSTDLIQAVLSV